jgi:RNA polymerase sigma-70 factor (ECF subfamily)
MSTTPASLLERLRDPQAEEAWIRFVQMYTPMIYTWARRAGASPDDASDLVQDVLTTLVRTLPTFTYEPGKSFRAWLKTVTLNRWREGQRKRVLATTGEADVSNLPADAEGPDLEEAEYRQHLVGRALQVMQAEFRPATWRACWACVVEQQPAAEVARELGISVNAVYLAKARVLRRLYQELSGLLD